MNTKNKRQEKGEQFEKMYAFILNGAHIDDAQKFRGAPDECINNELLKNEYTFGALSGEWLQLKSPQLKISSTTKYRNLLDSYLLPRFSNQQLSSISRSDIIIFSRDLLMEGGISGTGLSPKTVNCILSLLKCILEYGTREKNITTPDTKGIFVKQSQKPMRILSISEQYRLNKYLCDNLTPCNLGILLCLYTGLRIGEICALKWEDVVFEEQYLFVHRTMQRIQASDDSSRKTEIIIMPPKSESSIRRIPIPNDIFRILREMRKPPSAYLLTGEDGAFIEPRNMENHFKNVMKNCAISDVNFHALRHTFATRCVEIGFDVKSLSEILGHASVNITMNRYVHPSMELKQKNMNMLSKLLLTK